jgi:hypothetical protein
MQARGGDKGAGEPVRLRLCLPLVPAYAREIVVCKRAREFGYETVWLIKDSASSSVSSSKCEITFEGSNSLTCRSV